MVENDPPSRFLVGWYMMKKKSRASREESTAALLFISPFLILFACFKVFPIIYSFAMSFTKWNGFGRKVFLGLDNYRQLLTNDSTYNVAFRNTLILWVANLAFVVLIGFCLALIINRRDLPCRRLFRVCFYLPQAIAVVPLCLTFGYIFEFHFGFANLLLRSVGLPPVEWLLSPNMALVTIIGIVIWRTAPWHMVILLGGLQGIPDALFEAAEIDGCNEWQKIRYVTVPMLKPIFFYCFLMGSISSFQIFQEPFVITAGGPGDATATLSLYMYRTGFEFFKLGYASSITFVSLVIIMVLSVFVLLGFRSELE